MKLTPTIVLGTVVVAFGCASEPPTAIDTPIDSRAGGGSGCEAVQVTANAVGVFPSFTGAVSGDLEGAVEVSLGFAGATGVVFHNPGTEVWDITGGTIPALVGRTLEWDFVARSVNAPGQAPVVVLNGRSRLVDGASRGNLTFHGTLDTSVFPFVVDLDYHGVMCP